MPPKVNKFKGRIDHIKGTPDVKPVLANSTTAVHELIEEKASSERILMGLEDVVRAGADFGDLDENIRNPKASSYSLIDSHDEDDVEHFYIQICAQLPGHGGSKQYNADQKKVLVRAALKQYLDLHKKAKTIQDIKTPYQFMLDIAPALGVGGKNLAAWVGEFMATEDIADVERVRPSLVRIENARSLTIPHIVEVMTVIFNRKQKGLSTSYKVLREHLMSNKRENPLCSLDVLPPIDVSHDALRDAVTKVGGFGFGKVRAVGSVDKSEEDIIKRQYRIRVWIVEYYFAKRKERRGLVVVFSMDESYLHAGHKNNYSILPRDNFGNLIPEVNRSSGSGERTCMIGAVSIWGHLVTNDDDGNYVIDSDFLNRKGQSVERGGHFTELNNKGRPRSIYVAPAAPKSTSLLNKAEAIEEATRLNIPLDTIHIKPDGTSVSKRSTLSELRDSIKAARPVGENKRRAVSKKEAKDDDARAVDGKADKPTESGKKVSAAQAVEVDWDDYRKELQDMALTGYKFMIAGQHKGDYHDNFDTKSFFKWMVAFELTYPVWCQQMQALVDNGKLRNTGDFWRDDKPVREAVIVMDNAPYHHGVGLQLKSKNKDEIAQILKSKDISTIEFSTKDCNGAPVVGHCEIDHMERGWPNKSQLVEGAIKALKKKNVTLTAPPWKRIVESKRGKWGPADSPGMSVIFSAPYVGAMSEPNCNRVELGQW
jgi:hypothetical protein